MTQSASTKPDQGEGDAELHTYLDGVTGAVEANSYEQHMLWLDYAEDAARYGRTTANRYSWEPARGGPLVNIGAIAGRPIWVSLLTATVAGQKLLFWHVTSPVADHDQVEAWLKANLPATAIRDDGYINQTDPMNFCNILHRAARAATPETGA